MQPEVIAALRQKLMVGQQHNMPKMNPKLVRVYILLNIAIVLLIVVSRINTAHISYKNSNADDLALAINAANEEVQMKLEKQISIENCSLYYSDRFATGRDTFLNAITYSNKFTSPCYELTLKLAAVLHTNPIVFGITDLELRDRDLWLKYRSSKYFKQSSQGEKKHETH